MGTEITTILTALALYAAVAMSSRANFPPTSRLALSGARPTAIGVPFGSAFAATLYAVLSMMVGGCSLIYLGVMAWLSDAFGLQLITGKRS